MTKRSSLYFFGIFQVYPTSTAFQLTPAVGFPHNGVNLPFTDGCGDGVVNTCPTTHIERRSQNFDLIRSVTVHGCFDSFSEGVHGITHPQLLPQMFWISMVGSNTFGTTFLMTDDVLHGIQCKLCTQVCKQCNSRVIRTLCHRPCGHPIRTRDGCSADIPDTSWFTHFHTNMGVVTLTATMPSTMVPRQSLIDIAVVTINKGMDTSFFIIRIVPILNKD